MVEGGPVLAVLGAINVDLVVSGAPLPLAGQTVTGGTFAQHQGGKGGNQAVAAARALGRTREIVWMLGAVGDDQLGVAALEALRRDGVQTDHVLVAPDAGTGVALIAVGPDGENQISVAPGANEALEPVHVVEALERLEPNVLLASLEVPERTVQAALGWARDHAVPTVLNPAPPHRWTRDLVGLATYLTPNEHEREALGEIPSGVVVIETRGAAGAVIDRDGARTHVPAPSVDVVDTTGAGDCFNGVLAGRLAEGRTLEDAVADAVVAASISVSGAGAREGMPTSSQIQAARDRP
jgi:ribokinase